MSEVGLQYVRTAGREAGGAIGEIVAPHAAKPLVEAHFSHLVGDPDAAAQPVLQGTRIVPAETVEFGDLQAGLAALLAQAGRRQQHAAREDVGLYEIRMTAVALEEVVGDDDRLHQDRAARRDVALQHGEVVGPVALAHRLDHLDRPEVVLPPLHVAIVAELQVNPVAEAGVLEPRTGVLELLLGDRHTGDTHAAARRGLGEAAPAAADLQDAVALLGADLLEDALVL